LLFLLNFFFAKVTSPLETKKELTESLVFFSVAQLAREIGCFFEKWHFLEFLGD